MTYGVPGASASRHVVFDAPEDADGTSIVTATAKGGRCVVSITAGAGFTGHPLMFGVSSAADGCKATEDTSVPSGVALPDGGVSPAPRTPSDDGPNGAPSSPRAGCGCRVGGRGAGAGAALGALLALGAAARRRRARLR